jgi:hypothetical protein
MIVRVPEEYYAGRQEEIHVDFHELFRMYNLEALDKSLMSLYCL